MAKRLILFSLLVSALFVAVPVLAYEPAPEPGEGGRVVVLGMDGFDSRLVSEWMDAGELPHLAKLRDEGTFAPLMPANPAQSPVSWATLNTGKNPGKHGIYDFLRNVRRQNDIALDIGFQRRTRGTTPASESGILFASAGFQYGVIGAGVLLGAILFLMFRKKLVLAIILELIVLGGAVALFFMLQGSFPKGGFDGYESLSHAEPYWLELDRAGVPFRGHGVIVAYPVDPLEHGKVIAGLGAPDAKWGLNTFAIYNTNRSRERSKTYPVTDTPNVGESFTRPGSTGAGKIWRLMPTADGKYVSKLFGPVNAVKVESLRKNQADLEAQQKQPGSDQVALRKELDLVKRDLKNPAVLETWVPIEVDWSPGQSEVSLAVDGTTQTVALNSWSDFYRVSFKWSAFLSTSALVRFWVEPDGDGLEMFSSPLQIDPMALLPGTAICSPDSFAGELANAIGLYETLGWACQTHAVKDVELSDAAFLADIEYTYNWRMDMLRDAAKDDDWRVLFQFFGSPDRVCHMMMRHFDERHPQYVAEKANAEFDFFGEKVTAAGSVLAIYKQMDETVRYVTEEMLGPDDTLMIVSDHGFDSFRRQFSINNWLIEEGFIDVAWNNRYGQPHKRGDMKGMSYINWENSVAYSVAIGKIYLNLKGREPDGIVTKAEAEATVDKIIERLLAYRDPETGEQVVVKAYKREDIYKGDQVIERSHSNPDKRVDGAAEITLDLALGYRAAWASGNGSAKFVDKLDDKGKVVGAANGAVCYDNLSPWSGDHCGVDLSQVQGTFFCNKKTSLPSADGHYDAEHLAPTVLSLMGVAVPSDYDRQPITVQ